MAKETEKTEITEPEENNSHWLWKLSKPVTYNGEEISELYFNFDKLTGRDAAEIEAELMKLGLLSYYSQLMNVNYITRLAARACEKPIGIDLFDMVSIRDFHVLRNHTQLFLTLIPSD